MMGNLYEIYHHKLSTISYSAYLSQSGMFFIEEENILDFSLHDYKEFFDEIDLIDNTFKENYWVSMDATLTYEKFAEDYEAIKNGVWSFGDTAGEPIITLYGHYIPALLIAYANKDGMGIDERILNIDGDSFYNWIQSETITPRSLEALNDAMNAFNDLDESEPILTIVSDSELLTLAQKYVLGKEKDIFDRLKVGMKVRLKNKRMASDSLQKWKNVRNIDDDLVYASRSGVIEDLFVQELGGMKLVKIKGFGWCIPVEMIEEVVE